MQTPPHLPERFRIIERLERLDGEEAWLTADSAAADRQVVWLHTPWATLAQMDRIERSFRRLRGWRHPNLTQRVEFVAPTHEHRGWVAFEWLASMPLCRATQEASPAEKIDWFVEALRPLRMLHRQGVIHGRIHPDSLRLLVDGKESDGSSIRLGELLPLGAIGHEQLPAATLCQRPPECVGGGDATMASDLYAIGTLFFECLHGRPPFADKDDGDEGLKARIVSGRRGRPALPSGYPEALHGWIEKMLELDPTARFADAGEALAELIRCGASDAVEQTEADLEADQLADRHAEVIATGVSVERAADDRVSAIYKMIEELNSHQEAEKILESILDQALTVVGAERGMLLLRADEGDDFNVRLARNLEKETIAEAATFSRGVVAEAGSGRAVLSLDARNDERFAKLESVSRFGIHAVMCVPLRAQERIVGAVYLDSKEEGVFTPDDLRFLESFSNHAALALIGAQRRASVIADSERLQVEVEQSHDRSGMIGSSPQMQAVIKLIDKVASSELPVLIQGESGTGKELVAKAIHFNSQRKRQPFVSENCAAIPDSLLQSELFGHMRGSFTGAERDRAGLFEQAHLGTLFLDEIGDMSPTMQAQLLRALQEGEIRRVGGEGPIKVDARLLAATHRNLEAEAEAGRFRHDLLYRLQVLLIALPPLRERDGDVPELARHFLQQFAAQSGRAAPTISEPLMQLLVQFDWPGNVRQLQNTMQRLAVLSAGETLTIELLELDPALRKTLERDGAAEPAAGALVQSERERIIEALEAAKGQRARAARLLGISRATLYRKLKEYEIR